MAVVSIMHGTVPLPVHERSFLCCAESRVPDWRGVVKIIQFAHTRPDEEEEWKDEEEDDLDDSVEAGPSPTKSVAQLNLDLMLAFRDAKSSGFVIDSRQQDGSQPSHQGLSPSISRGSPRSPSLSRSLDNASCMLSISVTLGCSLSLPCSRALFFLSPDSCFPDLPTNFTFMPLQIWRTPTPLLNSYLNSSCASPAPVENTPILSLGIDLET